MGGYLQYQNRYHTPPSRKQTTSSSVVTSTQGHGSEEFIQSTTTTLPPAAFDLSSEFQAFVTSTAQNTVSTTIFSSTTSAEEQNQEEIEEVSSTTTTNPPQTTTATRRSTTIGPRGATRHHYQDIRQNTNKPSITYLSGSSSTAAPTKTTKINPKIYFKRKNETRSGAFSNTKAPKITTTTVTSDPVVGREENLLINSKSLSSASQIQIATTNLPEYDNKFLHSFSKEHYLTDSLEDAALLEIDQQLDNWDSGLLRASAGAGEESPTEPTTGKPESKKTLSDQVAEGKYGLIQTELFEKPIKRPGVISYEKNPDTPKDTDKNYGGLSDDEIWLAEDHLLILRGGSLAAGESDWVPIDAYEAPQRPVKIPSNPEVPPPFPVQLDENGPVQFIGNHQASFFGPFAPPPQRQPGYGSTAGQYPAPGPPPPPGFNPQNLPAWPGPVQNFTTDNGYNYPQPPTPTGGNPFLNYGPPPPPGGGSPFGVGVPPPFINGSLENANNTLDYPDEDDPSLYYPPPYSFVYKNNYSNPVPPGPLVPGIVLPPPPNFFTRLEGSLQKTNKMHGNRTALRKRPPQRVPIVRPHKITNNDGAVDSPVTKITKLTTTNLPPSVRRPISSTSTTTTSRTPTPTRLVNTNKNTNQQSLYIPKYKDQENVFINYEPPPPGLQSAVPKPVAPEYEDHYQNTVEQPPSSIVGGNLPSAVTQLKKVNNDPLIRFVGPQTVAQGNPVYFEYFDAQKAGQQQNHRTSTPGPTYIPLPVSTTTTQHPSTFFDYDKFSYVTPQPEIRPNGEPPHLSIHTQPDIIYQHLPVDPLKSNFNHEVETIRQTLNYYQTQPQLIPLSQQQQQQNHNSDVDYLQNQLPRTPKAKPVYQYSFDVNEGGNGITPSTSPKYSQVQSSIRPGLLDTTPFKPMVQYSAPLGSQADRDGFKPFQSYFSSSTPSAIPVTSPSPRPTQTRSKLLPIIGGHSQTPLGRPQQFNLNGDHLYNVQFASNGGPSFSGGGSGSAGHLRNVKPGSSFTGYYYDQQQPQQQQHHTAVDPYMQQIAALRQKLRHHSTFHEFYQHPNYNHFNGSSSLKYYPGQQPPPPPPQRPNSRFTDGHNNNFNQRIEQHQNLLAPQSQNTQYYSSSRFQNRPQTAQQQQQQQPFLSLEKDILVNYKYPLPAGNPDAETLPAEFLEQHRRPSNNNNQQRPTFYAPPQLQNNPQQQFYQYRLPGDQAHVYFLAPHEDQQRPQRQAKAMSDITDASQETTIKRRRRK